MFKYKVPCFVWDSVTEEKVHYVAEFYSEDDNLSANDSKRFAEAVSNSIDIQDCLTELAVVENFFVVGGTSFSIITHLVGSDTWSHIQTAGHCMEEHHVH